MTEDIEEPRQSTLLKLTAAQIASARELETRKSIVRDDDDPWWEKRGSRLWQKKFAMDEANNKIARSKSVGRSSDFAYESDGTLSDRIGIENRVNLNIAPIDSDNRLLTETKAAVTRRLQAEIIKERILAKSQKSSTTRISHSTDFESRSYAESRAVHHSVDSMPLKRPIKRDVVPEPRPAWVSVRPNVSSDISSEVHQLAGFKNEFKSVQSKLMQPTKAYKEGTWKKPSPVSTAGAVKKASTYLQSVTGDGTNSEGETNKLSPKQVPPPNERLLKPTASTAHGKWKKSEEAPLGSDKSPLKKIIPHVEAPARLLRPTAAYVRGQWTKPADESHDTIHAIVDSPLPTTIKRPVAVPDASVVERLTRPTAATTRGTWKKAEDDVLSNATEPTPRRATVELSANSRLTKSTVCVNAGKVTKKPDDLPRQIRSKTPEPRRPSPMGTASDGGRGTGESTRNGSRPKSAGAKSTSVLDTTPLTSPMKQNADESNTRNHSLINDVIENISKIEHTNNIMSSDATN